MKTQKLSNKGAAFVTVVMVMLVMVTLAGVAVTLIASQTRTEVFFENNTTALHAAEAGVNQYLWDMNEDSGDVIPLDTIITYPDYNPMAAFKLTLLHDSTNRKIIKSTGWMLKDPAVTRTIEATITKRSFTQYVYFSDNDPENIWWMDGENCYGPYHSNTNLYIKGSPTFWSNVSYVGNLVYYPNTIGNPNTASPSIFHVKPVDRNSTIDFPQDNSELMNIAKNSGGLYLDGRTSILLKANGRMVVWNQSTYPVPTEISLPSNGVIYVNGTTPPETNKFDLDSGNVFISGVLKGRLTVAAKNNIYITGYDPTVNNLSSSPATNGITYATTTFSLNTFTGVVTPSNDGINSDMLGLIADNYVAVLTRGWFNNTTNANSARQNMKVYAAVFAINKSFINSYQIDHSDATYPSPAGTLTVRGAIIQNKRGGVGITHTDMWGNVTNEGYAKDYAHDPRMMYDSPPHFIEPTQTGWEITAWEETN